MGDVFEPALLPMEEKQRMVRDLLDEFSIRVSSHSSARHELIIPCTITAYHKNQDKEPTGAFNYDKLVYKCLGCQASGGLLWFIAIHRGTSTEEARSWVGQETGTDGHLMELSKLLRYFDALQTKPGSKAPIPTLSERMLEPWDALHPWVTDPIEVDHRGVNIGGRGIPEETALKYRIGYSEHFPLSRDKTSERIVIPHFWKGKLVGWQTRRLANDGTPKYQSSADMPKDTTIFGYDPDGHDVAVVVESPMSTLKHDHHVHMPATFGANITVEQVRLLGRYKRVIFWLDNDEAGWRACEDLYDTRGKVSRLGIMEQTAKYTDVWAVCSPYYADPADLDDDVVDRLVAEAVPWVVWSPPPELLCPRCHQRAHSGGCAQ